MMVGGLQSDSPTALRNMFGATPAVKDAAHAVVVPLAFAPDSGLGCVLEAGPGARVWTPHTAAERSSVAPIVPRQARIRTRVIAS